jgi:hypothetical protein
MVGFKWAYGEEANVKEPIGGLKEHGWQEGDVPTASNFNWLFYELGYDLEQKAIDLEQIHTELNGLTKQVSALQQITQQLSETLAAVKTATDQNTIDSNHYKRAIAACIRVLNGATGERLGLDTGVRNDYPFPNKR